MSHLDKSQNVLHTRMVYWGPAGAGKTATLAALRRYVDPEDRLRLYSIATRDGNTRFFDMLALEDFTFGSLRVRMRIFGVPGDACRRTAREALLRDADAVVFVADSRPDTEEANLESLRDLVTTLQTLEIEPTRLPIVWSLNRRDGDAVPVSEMRAALGCEDAPSHETCATDGTGVFECFSDAFRATLESLVRRHAIVGPEAAGTIPVRLLPQLARGGRARFDRASNADDRRLIVRIDGEDAPDSAQAIEAQIRIAEAHAEADAMNRMLEGRNRELMAINRVARSILSAMEVDNLLVVLLDSTATYLGVTHASCVVFEGSGDELRSHVQGFGRDPVLGLSRKEARMFFELMQHSDGPIPASDERNPELLNALRRVDRRVRRALFQTIRGTDGLTSGWLGIYSTADETPVTTQRLLFLSSISRLAALGLEKIVLLERMRGSTERLERQTEEANTKLELARSRVRALNRGLESRVTERVRALEEANRSLKETRAAAVHRARLAGMSKLAGSFAKQIADPVDALGESFELLRHELDELRASVANGAKDEWDALRALDDFERIIEESAAGAARLESILSSLRRFGSSGEQESVSLNAVVADTVTVLEERIRACGDLDLRLGTLADVAGDSVQLSHVVLALLTNAVEAVERQGRRGRIAVSTFASRDQVTLMVQDTGCGIDERLLPRVFDPFVTGKEGEPNAGLGLHFAYRCVEAHGGVLKIRSRVGEGTTVKLLLPADTAAAPAPASADAGASDAAGER